MPCNKSKYVGRDVVLEYAIGCGDALPLPNAWKRLGSMRTKEFTLEWETTDASADDSIGALRENLATFQTMSISGDGTLKASGAGAANLIELTKHVANPVATSGQPFAWLRMTFPDLTFTAFMIISNMSRSAPFDDVVTYSFESQATSSDFGLIVEDTPDPDAPDVTSVEVTPATLSLEPGVTSQLNLTVLPAEAPQGVVWGSSDNEVATVSQAGLVTAISVGTATITATSSSDATKSDTCAVTVAVEVDSVAVTPDTATLSAATSETVQLAAAVSPGNAVQTVTWESSDTAVATVSATGLVTAVAEGTATITATSTADNTKSDTCAVTVTA